MHEGGKRTLARKELPKALELWNRLVTSLGLVGGLLIVAIAALSSWNIMSRYLARSPVVWADEICEFMLLICVFITLPLSWREDQHVRVDILYGRWSRKWRNRANLAFSFWAFLFCATLTWYGYLQARHAMLLGETSLTATSVATYPLLAFIPLGAFLLCIQIIISSWRMIKGKSAGDPGNSPESAGQAEREG
ncbi:MAG: TRAP transporter small permease [bacterium]|nr:TRAP transporter small permease [bacterium]